MSMPVRVLLDLPPDLAGCLLFTWLRFSALSRLNSAYCSHRDRRDLEAVYRSDTAVIPNALFVHDHNVERFSQFLTLRNIKFGIISLEQLKRAVPEDFLANCFGRHVHKLQLRKWDCAFSEVINKSPPNLCCNLQFLTLFSMTNLQGIVTILRNCQKTLIRLSFDNCTLTKKDCFQGVCMESVKDLKLWNLKSFNGPCIRALVEACPNVRTLGIRNTKLTKELVEICAAVPKLAMTTLSNSALSDDLLSVLLPLRFDTLLGIDVSKCEGITDAGTEFIVRTCARLHTISLAGCPRTTDRSLFLVAELCGSRLQCIEFGCRQSITDAGVHALAERCPNIKYMSAFYLSGLGISDAALVHLFSRCALLEQLDISSSDVGSAVLRCIAKHCTSLTYLSVYDATSPQSDGLAEVVLQCRQLRTLVVEKGGKFWCQFTVNLLRRVRPLLKLEHEDSALPYWNEVMFI